MADVHEQAGGAATQAQPSEDEMRAAYEAELNRITSSEMILQTAVSLLNIGGRRLGLAGPPTASGGASGGAGERDLEQVRDAIDGASALLPILERRMPRELGPLRDAVAQLQVAYARESQGVGATSTAGQAPPAQTEKSTEQQAPPVQTEKPGEQQASPPPTAKPTEQQQPKADDEQGGPGPAQASGRLWVPGR